MPRDSRSEIDVPGNDGSSPDLVWRLVGAQGEWEARHTVSQDLPQLATDALVAGWDSPTLRVLANEATNSYYPDQGDLLAAALRELAWPALGEQQALNRLLQYLCWLTVSGRITPIDGAKRVERLLGLRSPEPTIVGYFSGLADEWSGGWGGSREDVKREIVSEARKQVAGAGLWRGRRELTAGDGSGGSQTVRSITDLDHLLDGRGREAERDLRPQAVELDASDGMGALSIVVGSSRSVLSHVPADYDPPYFSSLGDELDDKPFTFYVSGDHHSESAWRHTIPTTAAREAARVFLLTGWLDPRIAWEEI